MGSPLYLLHLVLVLGLHGIYQRIQFPKGSPKGKGRSQVRRHPMAQETPFFWQWRQASMPEGPFRMQDQSGLEARTKQRAEG